MSFVDTLQYELQGPVAQEGFGKAVFEVQNLDAVEMLFSPGGRQRSSQESDTIYTGHRIRDDTGKDSCPT